MCALTALLMVLILQTFDSQTERVKPRTAKAAAPVSPLAATEF